MAIPTLSESGASDEPGISVTSEMRMLRGLWVTSYSGWMLFDPLPKPSSETPVDTPATFAARVNALPPVIDGYRWIPPSWTPPDPFKENAPGTYEQREGYFLVSALVGLNLDGDGGVTGFMRINRGGRGFATRELEGFYTAGPMPGIPWMFGGIIQETHRGEAPKPTTWRYSFVIRGEEDLDWIWQEGSYRPLVASGTFKRVRFVRSFSLLRLLGWRP